MNRILLIVLLLAPGFSGCKKETLYWQKIVHLESHTSSRLNRIIFADNNTCIIGGGEKYEKAEVLVSTDGGDTWTAQSFPEAGKGMYGLAVSPSKKVYLSGFDGKVIYSGNTGSSWNISQVPDWRYYIAIAYPTDDTGFFIATSAQGSGTIVRVDNNFSILDTTTYDFGFNDVAFPTAHTGYIAAFGTVLKTTDHGNTWKILDVKDDNFTAVYCMDENNVWICGYNGSIQHTIDGGATWKKIRNGNKITQPRYRLKDIVFKDSQTGWAVGENGIVIQTTDGGESWNRYSPFTEHTLLSITVTPGGNLLVAGEAGTLYKLYL